MSRTSSAGRVRVALLALAGLCAASGAGASIPGVNGPAFTLTAKADRITTPDGHSIYIWGFASGGGRAQYPAPTLKVTVGATVTITVVNQLPPQFNQRVSLAVAGLSGVAATCSGDPQLCVQGPITMEAATGGSVTYSFAALRPGTFLYNSASRPDLQVEMGLTGAMVVYPPTAGQAYSDAPPANQAGNPAGSQFDHEYLLFLSDMDSEIHDLVEQRGVQAVDDSGRLGYYFANYWFINGRNAPDTMAEAGVARLPTQPYSALVRTRPGDRVLMRVVGGGHDMHPFHHHGQHARIIAVDAFPLTSTIPFDLSHEVFTIPSLPGQTVDAILRWTGKGLGWDIYGGDAAHTGFLSGSCTAAAGHTPLDPEGLDPITHEYCADHGKPFPVVLPEALALTNGPFYSGSPYLGQFGLMPPGDGGLNPNAGYTFMWHSHNEKEITNFDIFPGGMMTMLVVEPPGTPIQ
jgi:FtsP/CotA-like multicopper oxidase with cupredoxin domain